MSPNLSVIRVSATYVDATGTPAAGTVTFTLSAVVVDRVFNQIILPTPVEARLIGGSFAVDLPATNDPDLVPTDLYYAVRESVSGQTRTYTIVLPFNGGAVDLADVVPLTASPSPTYALLRLSSMSDVSTVGLVNGNVLVWDAPTFTWRPGAGGSGGGGGTAASTVTAGTSFGVASAVGTSTAYARGDHAHGTPALGTSASQAAAGNHAHDYTGTYAPTTHTHAPTTHTHIEYAPAAHSHASGSLPFFRSGVLAAGTGTARIYNNGPNPWTIRGVRMSVGSSPVGTSVVVDVNVNGVTVFGSQAQRPSVAVGQVASPFATGMSVTAVPVDAYITVDVDQVGTTTPGSDLIVQVEIG